MSELDPPAPAPDDQDLLPLGSHVGPYIIVDRLGQGGMGQVFLGTDPRLRRKVALKCLIPGLGEDREIRVRILQEARAAARVNHPNVATIHDIVEEGARAFIVLEYVEGESLEAKLHRERLPMDRIVRIGQQLASALTAAHAKGVVHRDLKPANIQATHDGSVKILDFGIAKAMATLATVTSNQAMHQAAAPKGPPGTPGYMSPEQMQGQEVDARSDVYNLGLVLFEMATGQRAPQSGGFFGPRAIPRADEADPLVPKQLADIIARALQTDVRARFQTAAALGAALDGLDRPRQQAATVTAVLPAAAPASRLSRIAVRIAAGAAGAVLVLGLLGLISTAAFNLTLERNGPFGWQPLYVYPVWGFRSIFPTLVYILFAVIIAWAFGFLVHLVSLFEAINHPLQASRATLGAVGSRVGFNDPAVLSQGLAMGGLLTLAAVSWYFSDILVAAMTRISAATPADQLPLVPTNNIEQSFYGIALDLIVLTLAIGVARVVRMRMKLGIRGDFGGLIAAAAVLLIAVVMYEVPYRIVWQNDFEKIQYGNDRCYAIGETADQMLIHCPDVAAPRNRVIGKTDPAVRRLGVVESIFTPAG